MAEPERLDDKEQRFVAALLACSPELTDLASLARRFRTMVREQRAGGLDRWLTLRDPSEILSLRGVEVSHEAIRDGNQAAAGHGRGVAQAPARDKARVWQQSVCR